MDADERERLQALVDAVRLTAEAIRARRPDLALAASAEMRASGPPLAATWWPTPVPRGWSPDLLGAESDMFVPYLNPYLSQVVPFYPGVGSSNGLVHAGPGSIGGGVPVGIGLPSGGIGYSPIYSQPYSQPYPQPYSPLVGQSYYGYRPSPIPYGFGLLHAGYESSIPGSMSPFVGYNPFMSGSVMGMSPMGPMSMQSMPMQPAWSMGSPVQPNGSSSIPQG